MLQSLSIKIISKLDEQQSIAIFTKLLKKSLRNSELRAILSVLPRYGLVQEQYIENNLVMILQLLNITLLSILLKDITFK